MDNINPQIVLSEILDKKSRKELIEYMPEIEIAMKRYAGLCMNEVINNENVSIDFTTYMSLRTSIDKLMYNQV